MAGLYGTQLTDEMMVNPWMFDPSQQSNQFSNFNNQALPYPPTYGGTPVSAATGQPIQSYQNWLRQNPAGVTLNATPAAPAATGAPDLSGLMQQMQLAQMNQGSFGGTGQVMGQPAGGAAAAFNQANLDNLQRQYNMARAAGASAGPGPTGGPAGTPQGGGPSTGSGPNNWNAALSALANPGTPAIGGATVPMMTGSQPAGGVNAAWLQQMQGRPGMNQNFVNALQAIQGRR